MLTNSVNALSLFLPKRGNPSAILHMVAEACKHCGERLYSQETVKHFEQIRHKLDRRDFKGFKFRSQRGMGYDPVILTSPKHEESLKQQTPASMTFILENPELEASLQQTGSQWVRQQHHTWEATTSVYQDIYAGLRLLRAPY